MHLHLGYRQNEGTASRQIRLGIEKTVCSGFWIQKHASFPPTRTLEGEQLRFPPSNARLTPLTAHCLLFSGRIFIPALRPRGHIPLDSPLICVR
jgi:hypothetical protein